MYEQSSDTKCRNSSIIHYTEKPYKKSDYTCGNRVPSANVFRGHEGTAPRKKDASMKYPKELLHGRDNFKLGKIITSFL